MAPMNGLSGGLSPFPFFSWFPPLVTLGDLQESQALWQKSRRGPGWRGGPAGMTSSAPPGRGSTPAPTRGRSPCGQDAGGLPVAAVLRGFPLPSFLQVCSHEVSD